VVLPVLSLAISLLNERKVALRELHSIRGSCGVRNANLLATEDGVGDASGIRCQRRRSHTTCFEHRSLQGDKDCSSRCDCVCDHEKNDRQSKQGD
jgi:hypothetical protein